MRHALKWICCLLLLAGCHRSAQPAASTGAAPATAASVASEKPAGGLLSMFSDKPTEAAPAPTPELGEFKIVSVTLGNAVDAEQQVLASKTVFGRYDRIYAAVLSTGQHQGLKLSAKWTTADGQPVADSEQTLVPTSATVTTFSLRNGAPWPVGKYQLVVSIDQQPQDTLAFEVR